jgi:lysophospholipase L1-like esterase
VHWRLVVALTPACLVALACLLAVPDASAAQRRVAGGRTAIGDSVMLGAKSRLQHRGFSVDAVTSRQVADGVDVLRAKKRHGALPKQVVVHLGTNGTFSAAQCRAMHHIVGQRRHLVLLSVKAPRSWTAANNRVISHCAERYRNTVEIDWRRYANRHDGLLESDGYHLTPKGARRYAALIDRKVDQLSASTTR